MAVLAGVADHVGMKGCVGSPERSQPPLSRKRTAGPCSQDSMIRVARRIAPSVSRVRAYDRPDHGDTVKPSLVKST